MWSSSKIPCDSAKFLTAKFIKAYKWVLFVWNCLFCVQLRSSLKHAKYLLVFVNTSQNAFLFCKQFLWFPSMHFCKSCVLCSEPCSKITNVAQSFMVGRGTSHFCVGVFISKSTHSKSSSHHKQYVQRLHSFSLPQAFVRHFDMPVSVPHHTAPAMPVLWASQFLLGNFLFYSQKNIWTVVTCSNSKWCKIKYKSFDVQVVFSCRWQRV